MLGATNADAIFAKKASLDHTVYIRCDSPKEERAKHAVLLKERWKLINNGTNRRDR